MLTRGFTVCISPLSMLETKERGTVIDLRNLDAKTSERVRSMGIIPGVQITLERRLPFLRVEIGEKRLNIDRKTAASIYVRVKIEFKKGDVYTSPRKDTYSTATITSVDLTTA